MIPFWKIIFASSLYGCGGTPRGESDRPPPQDRCPECDSDGDAIPDREDVCPDIAGATHNGCPPETILDSFDGEEPLESDPVPSDFQEEVGDPEIFNDQPADPLLRPEAEILFLTDGKPQCPQISWKNNRGTLAWQSGSSLFRANVVLQGSRISVEEPNVIGEVGGDSFRFCNIQKGVAINSSGDAALLWGKLKNGNQIDLQLEINEKQTVVDTIWLPHLGEERRNTSASVAALPDGRFVVIWIGGNQDKLMGQIFSNQGEPLSEPTLLYRKIEVLFLSDPDVAATIGGEVRIVWKEGEAPFGNIQKLLCQIRENILEPQASELVEAQAGRWPSLSNPLGNQNSLAWRGLDGTGHLLRGDSRYSFGQGVLSPQVIADETAPVVVWSEELRRDVDNVFAATVGSDTVYLLAVGEGVGGDRVAIAPLEQGALIAYTPAFPGKALRLIQAGWAR